MNNKTEILEEFNISELEDRVEFGLCGGGGGDDGEPGNPGCRTDLCDITDPK